MAFPPLDTATYSRRREGRVTSGQRVCRAFLPIRRKARLQMRGASGANALGCECPPASALGRRLLLDFAPKGIRPRVPTCAAIEGAKREVRSSWQACDQQPGAAGSPSGRNQGGGSRRRRMPGDIRPEGLPVAPGPSDGNEACDQTNRSWNQAMTHKKAPQAGGAGGARGNGAWGVAFVPGDHSRGGRDQ